MLRALFQDSDPSPVDLIRYSLIVLLGGSLTFALLFTLTGTAPQSLRDVALVLGGSLTVLLLLLRRGHIRAVTVLLPVVLWMVVTLAFVTGLSSQLFAALGYLLTISLAAILLGEIAGLAVALAAVGVFALMTLPGADWQGIAVIYVMVALIQGRIVQHVRKMFEALRFTNETLKREIEHRKQMEAAVRASEARYRHLFDSVPIGIFTKDLEGRYTSTNDYNHIYTDRNPIGLADAELQPPEIAERIRANDLQVMAENREMRFDEHFMTPQGLRSLESYKVPLHDEQGEVTGVLGVALDVTEKQRLAEELDRFFNLSLDSMCILDREGYFRRVNPAMQQVLGYDKDELIGHQAREFIHPDDVQASIQARQQTQAGQTFHRYDVRMLTKSGEAKWLSWASIATETGFYSVARDVTDTKRQEEERAATERTLRDYNTQLLNEIAERRRLENERDVLYEIIPDLMCAMDSHGRFLQVNPAFEKTLGFPPSQLLSHTFTEFIADDNRDRAQAIFQAEDSQPRSLLAHFQTQSGEARALDWVIVRADERFYAIGRDMTETRRLEQMRNELEIQQAVTRMKHNFVGQVSHEFRTPLTVILSSSEILQNYYDRLDDEKRQRHLDKINGQVHHMVAMIDDLLLIDSMGNSQLDLETQEIDFVSFCQNIIDEFQPLHQSNQTLAFTHHNLPPKVNVDPKLLHHILTNLFSNAIKYSPEGGAIRLSADFRDGMLHFSVSDEGMGIDEQDQTFIFEPFRRTEATQFMPGTGLGLTIVRNSVDKHGGTIQVHSQPGQGTTFHIQIPVGR